VSGEAVLNKGWVDPFLNTPLLAMLNALRISTIFLGGVATNFVVESAARHAGDLGLDVVLVDDMCASFTSQLHENTVQAVMPVFGRVIAGSRFRDVAAAA
jgi:nicotinamidase-related amidase